MGTFHSCVCKAQITVVIFGREIIINHLQVAGVRIVLAGYYIIILYMIVKKVFAILNNLNNLRPNRIFTFTHHSNFYFDMTNKIFRRASKHFFKNLVSLQRCIIHVKALCSKR